MVFLPLEVMVVRGLACHLVILSVCMSGLFLMNLVCLFDCSMCVIWSALLL